MKFSLYATLALTTAPAVSALNYVRRTEAHDDDDQRVSFVVGLENCVLGLADAEQLINSGWDASALANSDGDDSTHLWSELNPNCPTEEILISGVADTFDIHDLTLDRFFIEKDTGTEDHRDNIFLCSDFHDCAEYVEENPTAITFFTTSLWESAHSDDTHQIGLKNDEMNFVVGLLETDPCIFNLAESGWDATSIANSDGDDSTHLWSEIDPACPAEEIHLSALTDEDWRHDYVFGEIFVEKETGTEDHRDDIFLCPTEDECAEFVEENQYGITFFTKARWAEEHIDDTLPVNTVFIPPYLDFN